MKTSVTNPKSLLRKLMMHFYTASFFVSIFLLPALNANAQNFWELNFGSSNNYLGHYSKDVSGNIYLSEDGIRIYRTMDGGDNWELLDGCISFIPGCYPLTFTASNIAVGTAGFIAIANYYWTPGSDMGRGVFISTDGGNYWTQKNNGLGGDTATENIYAMPNGNLIVEALTTMARKMYVSTDAGDNWTYVMDVNTTLGTAVLPSGEVWLVGDPSYSTTDNGVTWTQLGAEMDDSKQMAIASNGNYFKTKTVSGSEYLYKSTDNGATWAPPGNNGLPPVGNTQTSSFVITPNDTLFVTTADSGVYWSADYGENWSRENSGLPDLVTGWLELTDQGYLLCYATTWGNGIYRSTQKVYNPSSTGVNEPFAADNPFKIYPNPANGSITIEIEGNITHGLKLQIIDIAGTVIYTEQFAVSTPSSTKQIDLSGFARGMYFVKLHSDDLIETKKIIIQ